MVLNVPVGVAVVLFNLLLLLFNVVVEMEDGDDTPFGNRMVVGVVEL